MNKTTEALELAEALENDAKEHREVSYGLDCPPERTANWKHALNCEAAARLIREALAEPQITTPDVCGEVCARAKLCYGCGKAFDEALAEPVREPVAYLDNGTRFKVTLTDRDCYIKSLPRKLGGRWVALVAAEDDRHLNAAPVDAKAIRAEALEEAAEWCDRLANNGSLDAEDCAEGIRGLK